MTVASLMGGTAVVSLSDEELASGMVTGFDPGTGVLHADAAAPPPREALSRILSNALQRPPCILSFSGGRDSSALLGLAVGVARAEGLALPVPMTLRVEGSEAAEESSWQESVLRHLGLDDWLRVGVTDQLDAVGPVATGLLSRHGLMWPFNVHFHVPMFEAASGGTVVTGFGGDELGLIASTSSAERILAGHCRPRPRDVPVVAVALAPRPFRAAVLRKQEAAELRALPWLTEVGIRRVASTVAASRARHPLGWGRMLRRAFWPSRYVQACRRSFEAAARPYDVRVVHPFADPDVLVPLARNGGFSGFEDRTALVQALFGDILPPETVRRTTKATFDDAVWTEAARRFGREWSGGGLPELVDVHALRHHWASGLPLASSATLIQAAWLHDHHPALLRSARL